MGIFSKVVLFKFSSKRMRKIEIKQEIGVVIYKTSCKDSKR